MDHYEIADRGSGRVALSQDWNSRALRPPAGARLPRENARHSRRCCASIGSESVRLSCERNAQILSAQHYIHAQIRPYRQ